MKIRNIDRYACVLVTKTTTSVSMNNLLALFPLVTSLSVMES